MLKKLVMLVCAYICLVPAFSARAQSVLFYDNSIDTGFFFPSGAEEFAIPISFTGSYIVERVVYQFVLPEGNASGPTTDAILRFYEPGPSLGAFGDGILIQAIREETLPESSGTNNVTVDEDLTFFGDHFQWNALPIITGETGGWLSVQFTNPEAGLVTAIGGTDDDIFQNMTDGEYLNFGGVPQASFLIQIYGTAVVPEPGVVALMVGLLVSGVSINLLRRRRAR